MSVWNERSCALRRRNVSQAVQTLQIPSAITLIRRPGDALAKAG